MDLTNNEAAVHASSTNVDADSLADEVDLYDELVAFAELSPEEQRVQAKGIDKTAREGGSENVPPEPTTPMSGLAEATTEPATVSAFDDENSMAPGETSAAGAASFLELGNTGPLLGSSPESPFTGAMTRGVCLACGSESGVNDLFCVSCGSFVDEAEATLVSIPTCSQCGLDISADEIFCPRCGAVLAAS